MLPILMLLLIFGPGIAVGLMGYFMIIRPMQRESRGYLRMARHLAANRKDKTLLKVAKSILDNT